MSRRFRLVTAFAVALTLLGAAPAFGWGASGHRITAEIAQGNLSPEAAAAIRAIIGEEHLAEIATWPDDIRSDPSWDFAKPWHFVSIARDKSFDDYKPAPEGDVIQAMRDFEAFLRDPRTPTIRVGGKTIGKREALAFYVHFVGDIHQPLHVGRKDDQGANKIQVEWFGDEVNLHTVWDERLIESTKLSYTEFSTFLDRVPDEVAAEWQASGYLVWAEESKAKREHAYEFGEQREAYYLNIRAAPVLSYEYRSRSLPIIRERLVKGGIRLAGKLNDIFAGYEPASD